MWAASQCLRPYGGGAGVSTQHLPLPWDRALVWTGMCSLPHWWWVSIWRGWAVAAEGPIPLTFHLWSMQHLHSFLSEH